MMKCYICHCFLDFSLLSKKKSESMTLFGNRCILKNMFVYRSIVLTGIQCDVCFKCMFYILKVRYYRRSESVKEMMNDCWDRSRDYTKKTKKTNKKINCLEVVDTFFNVFQLPFYFVCLVCLMQNETLKTYICRDLICLI